MVMWYSSLIYDSLEAGLSVSLYIVPDGDMKGYLGVKIEGVEFPFFAWESFEQPIESQEEVDRATLVKMEITKKNRVHLHQLGKNKGGKIWYLKNKRMN